MSMLQDNPPLFINLAAFNKKPYDAVAIQYLHDLIAERTAYLDLYEPRAPKQIDIKLSNLYSQLNSYNLNPPAVPVQTIQIAQSAQSAQIVKQIHYFTRYQKRIQDQKVKNKQRTKIRGTKIRGTK